MGLPREFVSFANFDLAFDRIVRAGNREYKQFYRHLFASYNLARKENLADLLKDIREGSYSPDKPTVVYQPKKSGVLRPLTLLTLKDSIVYQALLNRIAGAFESEQHEFALKRSFGAIFAGKTSLFFYRSWKTSYRKYNDVMTAAFEAGNDWIADFDLVSFYELIDHNLLAERLARKVKNKDLIQLLLRCLRSWTSDRGGTNVAHGVPQGPEASAFLAECLLFHFDSHHKYRDVKYFRYIDDIKLMAKDEVPLRRSLLRLDLQSKELGLVPQAQKIECRKVKEFDEVLKTIPSALAAVVSGDDLGSKDGADSQKKLLKVFRNSLDRKGNRAIIDDATKFKFALHRLKPRRDVLRRIVPFLVQRPDLSWALSSYIRRFGKDMEAADLLLSALQRDPTYDAAAANYY